MYNQQIMTFVTVAELGSFSKASKKLFVTTVSVMKQINSLENHIGVKLLIRSNHGVRLTKAGQEVYKTAKEIIELSNKTIKKLQADKKRKRNRNQNRNLFVVSRKPPCWFVGKSSKHRCFYKDKYCANGG